MADATHLDLATDRPALLLDIDGVINVFQCTDARETRVAPHLPALKLLPGCEEWLAQLGAAFQLIWCSHPEALAALGALTQAVGQCPAIAPLPGEAGREDWKTRAVRAALEDYPGELAWVEDGFPLGAREWAAERLRRGKRTWLIDVSETGLNAEITASLIAWAQP